MMMVMTTIEGVIGHPFFDDPLTWDGHVTNKLAST
jgi:hypothetical protein